MWLGTFLSSAWRRESAVPSIGSLHIYSENPWFIVGKESILKKSMPTGYVIGYSPDTERFWVFDITHGWVSPKTTNIVSHNLLGVDHKDTHAPEQYTLEIGDLVMARETDNGEIKWQRFPRADTANMVLTSINNGVSWKRTRFPVRINGSDPTVEQERLNLVAGNNINLTINEDTNNNESVVSISATPVPHQLLDSDAHTDTITTPVTRGMLAVGMQENNDIKWKGLPLGSDGYFLRSNGMDAVWGAIWWDDIQNKPYEFPVTVKYNSATVGTRPALNFIEGTNVTLNISDDQFNNEVDIVISVNTTSNSHNLLDSSVHLDTNTDTVTRGALVTGQLVGSSILWALLSLGSSGSVLKSNGDDAIWGQVLWDEIGDKPSSFPVTVRRNSGANVGTRPRLNFIEGSNISISVADDSVSNEVDITIGLSGTNSHNLLDGSVHSDTSSTTVARGMLITGQLVGGVNRWRGLSLGGSGTVVKSNGVDAIWGSVDWAEVANKPTSFPVTVRRNSGSDVGTRPRLNFIEGNNISLSVSDDSVGNEIDITIGLAGTNSHNLLDSSVHSDTFSTTVARGMIITGQLISGVNRWSGLSLGDSGTVVKSNGTDAVWGSVNWTEITNKPTEFPVTVRKNSGTNVGTRPRLNFIEGSNISLTISDDGVGNEVDITISASGGVGAHSLLDSSVHTDTDTTTVARGMLITGQLVSGSNKWKGLSLGSSGTFVKSNGTDVVWSNVDWADIAGKPTEFPVTVRRNSGANIGTRPRLNFIEGSNITLSISDDVANNEIDITISASGAGQHNLLSDTHPDTNPATVARGMIITGQTIGGINKWASLSLGLSGRVVKSNGTDVIWGQVDWSEVTNKPVEFPVTVRRNSGANIGTRPRLNFIEGSNIVLNITDDAVDNEVDINISATPPTHNLLSSTHPDTEPSTVTRGSIIVGQNFMGTIRWARMALGSEGQFVRSNGTDAVWAAVDWIDIANKPTAFPVTVRVNSGSNVGTRPRLNFIAGSNILISASDSTADNEVAITVISPSHNLLSSAHLDAEPASVTRGSLIVGQITGSGTRWARLSLGANGNVLKSDGNDAVWGSVHWTEIAGKPTAFPIDVRRNSGAVIGTRPKLNFIEGSNITLSISDNVPNNEVQITINSQLPPHNLLSTTHSDTEPATVQRGSLVVGKIVGGVTKWASLSIGGSGQFIRSDGLDALWENVNWNDITGKPSKFSIEVYENGSSVAIRPGINFIESSGITISTADNAGLQAVNVTIKAEPFSQSNSSVQLNAAFNFTDTDTIVDAGGTNPKFQQVISTAGKWYFIITMETTLRVGLSSGSSGTGQIVVGAYKREGTTDTLIRNIRLNYMTYFGSAGTSSPTSAFNSIQIWIPIDITYTGNSTDIRGALVNGTVLFLKGRYTTTTGLTVSIAQALSTSALDAVMYNK